MQYLITIFEDESNYEGEAAAQADMWQKILQAHEALAGEMAEAGILRGGAGLKPSSTATSLIQRAGKMTLHDGPYTESKEQLGGFYLIEVEDLERAIDWAKRIPLAADGSIEIRATMD